MHQQETFILIIKKEQKMKYFILILTPLLIHGGHHEKTPSFVPKSSPIAIQGSTQSKQFSPSQLHDVKNAFQKELEQVIVQAPEENIPSRDHLHSMSLPEIPKRSPSLILRRKEAYTHAHQENETLDVPNTNETRCGHARKRSWSTSDASALIKECEAQTQPKAWARGSIIASHQRMADSKFKSQEEIIATQNSEFITREELSDLLKANHVNSPQRKANEEIKELQNEITLLKGLNKELQNKIKMLQDKKDLLKGQNQDLHEETKSLRKVITDLENLVVKVTKELTKRSEQAEKFYDGAESLFLAMSDDPKLAFLQELHDDIKAFQNTKAQIASSLSPREKSKRSSNQENIPSPEPAVHHESTQEPTLRRQRSRVSSIVSMNSLKKLTNPLSSSKK